MDNCTNLKRKEILRLRAFLQPVASQVRSEVSKVSCECTGFTYRLFKCSWSLQRGFLCLGFKSPLQCSVSAGTTAQQTGCVLAMVYPAHASCPALQSLCPLATMRIFLSQKLEACFDKNSVGQEHMLNKTKV